jgi:methylated-DNA-protein-cysteine methyltransferase-like protein
MADKKNSTLNEEDAALAEKIKDQVFDKVREIPTGRVLSYGGVGALCDPPISGYICGRIMGNVPEGVPWWRVVGKEGNLPIRKRTPELEDKQHTLLKDEGIEFDEDGHIPMDRFEWRPNALF